MTLPKSEPTASTPRQRDSLFLGNSEMAARMRAFDWSSTSIGPCERWPQSVRAIVRMMLTSRYAMWMGWGPDLAFFYNDAYAAMTLGAKHPWALGQRASEVWTEIWPDIGPRIAHVLSTGEATWDEGLLLFLERNGFPEETYHTFSYSPLHDDSGEIGGMFCVVTEDTTRVIGERRLAKLRELGKHIGANHGTDVVWRALEKATATDARDLPFSLAYAVGEADRQLTLVAQSPGDTIDAATAGWVPEVETWPAPSVIAEPLPLLVALNPAHPWPQGPWPKRPTHALLLPIAQQGQARPAGVFVAGLNPYRPLDDDYRSFIALYVGQLAAALADAQAYAAEQRRVEALAQLDRAKTTFFTNVSHELRTPLTLIQAPVDELLRSATLPEPQRAQLSLVHRNALRLQRLVNALLDFSRVEAGRVQPSFEPVDLAALTADIVAAFRSATDRAGLTLVIACEPVEGPVFVDVDLWEQVVLNLVSNAFKFTLEGQIRVALRGEGRVATLTVEDSGSGIPADELPRIFERFHRIAGRHGRTHEGTGIGLALVHELVKLHGGTITVSSEPGRGSVFCVSIPLGSAHLTTAPTVRSGRAESIKTARSVFVEEALGWLPEATGATPSDLGVARGRLLAAPAAGGARDCIVLADDNADMRHFVEGLLASKWDVMSVANGRDALRAVHAHRPALLITDVMMPEMDGFELLDRLRRDPATADIPVMMLSARAGEESRVEGLKAGADDYLIKPFSARELVARVETQLLRRHVRLMEWAQQRTLQSVFAQAPVAIALLRGPDHVFEMANPWYLDLIDRRDVIGKPLREALPEVARQGLDDVLDRVYSTGEPHVGRSLPLVINRSDDQPEQRYFDFVYQPLRDFAGAVDSIAAVVYDVTGLAQARDAAEVANRAKDEFLAMLGHELRNPLAPILTALQLLRLRGVDAAERERNVIERQVTHLVRLVDDLLDVSRITGGKIELRRRPIELSDVVAKAIETASPLLEQLRHVLRLSVPSRGLLVNGDLDRLAQVVANLLTNAAKYTEAGGEIMISAAHQKGEIVLRVRDSGIGISAETLPKVFELFVQDRQASERARGGLGLGLAIVKSLVALHDGTVSAESEGVGRGATFTVRLPRLPRERGSDRESTTAGPLARGAARPTRILVVDDNRDAAAMLAAALSVYGHDVRIAHDGPAALTVVEDWRPEVAVLDLGLPVMDGYELAERLRLGGHAAGLRLIALSGYGQERDRRRTEAAGFAAHFVKPVELEPLHAAIESGAAPPS
jgi:signal transduction histidine kinase